MNRLLLAAAAATLLALSGASGALAQTPPTGTTPPAATAADTSYDANWPTYPLGDDHYLPRGPGWYVSLWKVALIFFVIVFWVKTTDWVSRDCVQLGLNYDLWNSIILFPFLIGFLFFALLIPIFLLGFPLFFLCYVVPLSVYIHTRNAYVPDADKVLTKEHIRYVVANFGKNFGANIDAEKKMAHEKGPPVTIVALGGENEQKNQANLIEARQSPAFIVLKEIIADCTAKRAERVLLDYTAENVGVKYMIDGVWLDLPARDRPSMDPLAAVLKKLCNLNMADRKSKQEGAFSAEYQGAKLMCSLQSQGTPTGERVLVTYGVKGQKFNSLEELGMREKMRDQLKELLQSRKGLIAITALPSGGLTTTMTFTLKATDRLLRDFIAVGDKTKHEPEVENVEVTGIDPAKDDLAAILKKLILKQPDVFVIREILDGPALEVLCEQCEEDPPKLSIFSLRAKDAIDGLARIDALKVPASTYAPELLGVLNQRLIRKLCDKCKEAYDPPPELLAKLGIPAGRVVQLFRERQPLPPDSKEKRLPCTQCNEIGYFGRTSIFELLVLNDKIREALIKDPKPETIRKVAKATGHRGLMEEGIALVALGVTSLTELQRTMKQ